MPLSDDCRTTASVPRRSGEYLSSEIVSVTSAWPSSVRSMSVTVPIARPDTCTRLPLTSCAAFWKCALTT